MKLTLAASCIAGLLAVGPVAAQTTPSTGQQPPTVARPPAPAQVEDPHKPGSPGTQSGAAPAEQGAPASGTTQDRRSSPSGSLPPSSDGMIKGGGDRIYRN